MVRQFIPNIEARESRRRPNSPLQCIDVAGPLSLNASVYRHPNPITAKDFLAFYENMRVRYIPYEGSCVREVVAHVGTVYSNPAHPGEEDSNPAEAWRIKQRITDCQNNPRSPIRITTNHLDAIIQCRAGRGAVQHSQTYLSYALSYTHNHPRPRIQPSELSHYCGERTGTKWAWLGLDCIGFVNRYLMASGRIPATMAGASPGIEQHRDRQRPGRRMNVGQIEANDLIIQGESGHQHIAIVNRVVNRTTTTTPDIGGEAITTLEVSESSQSYGGLVTHNWYILSDRGGGNFRCRKPNQTRNIQDDWGFYAAPPIAARGRTAAG